MKYHEAVFELLSKQLEIARLDEARQGGTIQSVDVAIPPDKRSFPRRTPMVIMGFLLAIAAAMVAAVAVDRWEATMSSPRQRERMLALAHSLTGRE